MTAMEYAIRDACDGDRRPNAARELLTVGECVMAYKEITEGHSDADRFVIDEGNAICTYSR